MIVEEVIQWVADALAYSTLGVILLGIWQGTRRQAARMSGPRSRWLAIPWFYLVTTLLFLGLCRVGWRPLPFPLHGTVQGWFFALGSLLYFPGMLLALWGRLELGHNYSASSALASRLFEEHQLVMTGPYSIVRHPMYAGFALAAFGSVPMYFTWTTLCFALLVPLMLMRVQVEERVLAVEFREAWWVYCDRVPMLIPNFRRRKARWQLDATPVQDPLDIEWQKVLQSRAKTVTDGGVKRDRKV